MALRLTVLEMVKNIWFGSALATLFKVGIQSNDAEMIGLLIECLVEKYNYTYDTHKLLLDCHGMDTKCYKIV